MQRGNRTTHWNVNQTLPNDFVWIVLAEYREILVLVLRVCDQKVDHGHCVYIPEWPG